VNTNIKRLAINALVPTRFLVHLDELIFNCNPGITRHVRYYLRQLPKFENQLNELKNLKKLQFCFWDENYSSLVSWVHYLPIHVIEQMLDHIAGCVLLSFVTKVVNISLALAMKSLHTLVLTRESLGVKPYDESVLSIMAQLPAQIAYAKYQNIVVRQ